MESDAPLAASKHRRSARRSAFRSLVLPVGNQIHGEDNAERVESDSAAASLPGSSIIERSESARRQRRPRTLTGSTSGSWKWVTSRPELVDRVIVISFCAIHKRDTPSASPETARDLNLPDEDNEILAHANPILGNAKLSDRLF